MTAFRMARLFDLLGIPAPDLLLRNYGRNALPILTEELLKTSAGQALLLDFAGVSVVDTSFADESILELALGLVKGEWGDRFIILSHPTSATIDNLEGTIARRGVKIALIVADNHRLRIVGQIEPNLSEAWMIALEEGRPLTARHLADRLGLEINTASMRLSKLYRARLLRRHEDVTPTGRQYVYTVPS